MEIIDTVVRNGKTDLITLIVFCLIFLIGCIIAVKTDSPLMMLISFVNFVAFCVTIIVVVFLPEQESYKAVVTDYEEVQDSGYVIIERLEDDIYRIEKANDELEEK